MENVRPFFKMASQLAGSDLSPVHFVLGWLFSGTVNISQRATSLACVCIFGFRFDVLAEVKGICLFVTRQGKEENASQFCIVSVVS